MESGTVEGKASGSQLLETCIRNGVRKALRACEYSGALLGYSRGLHRF